MNREAGKPGDFAESVHELEENIYHQGQSANSRLPILTGTTAGIFALFYLASTVAAATASGPIPSLLIQETVNPAPGQAEVIVYASDLPKSALSEFDFWNDPASPGGRMVGTPNKGDELDPPPENDPHVTFKVQVQRGVPYRCWIHMKVGAPKGKSQANMLWVQFSDAVDKSGNEVFKPGTGSYLTAHGPVREGWYWLACGLAGPKWSEPLVYFRTGGEVTVRLQAGMEGVGFDQFLLSPAQFLEKPPSQAVVPKPKR